LERILAANSAKKHESYKLTDSCFFEFIRGLIFPSLFSSASSFPLCFKDFDLDLRLSAKSAARFVVL